MKRQNPVLIFLLKFFVTYFGLFAIYSTYLQKTQVKIEPFQCAPVTQMVAKHVKQASDFLGYNIDIEQYDKELAIDVYVGNKMYAKIVEGCNGFSIIILFIAFIVAFSGSFKATLLYIFFGSLLIYGINILRIVFFVLLLYKYPAYQEISHKLIFPAIIYGLVFLLWVIWVQYFSNQRTKNA